MNKTVIAGTSVRAVNTFHNFEGLAQDPDLVRFKVYDESYKLLDNYTLTDANKLSEGKYFYDYITPSEPYKTLILEFYGEIAGNPTIERMRISTTFMKG